MSSTLDSQFLMKAQTAIMSGNKDFGASNLKSTSQAREVAQDFESPLMKGGGKPIVDIIKEHPNVDCIVVCHSAVLQHAQCDTYLYRYNQLQVESIY